MIRFTYTNALNVGTDQKEPTRSLGGFASSTPVRNGSPGAIFGDLSAQDRAAGTRRTIGIAAENVSGETLSDVRFGLRNGTKDLLRFALVGVVDGAMEQIPDASSVPFVGDFADVAPGDEVSGLEVFAEMAPGVKVGIWLQRVTAEQDIDLEAGYDVVENDFDVSLAWD